MTSTETSQLDFSTDVIYWEESSTISVIFFQNVNGNTALSFSISVERSDANVILAPYIKAAFALLSFLHLLASVFWNVMMIYLKVNLLSTTFLGTSWDLRTQKLNFLEYFFDVFLSLFSLFYQIWTLEGNTLTIKFVFLSDFSFVLPTPLPHSCCHFLLAFSK